MTGMPIWYELMTPDPAGVAEFYRAVGGWDIPAQGNTMPNGSEYREIKRPDGGNLGGVLTQTQAMRDGGARPGWIPYFHVKGVEDACAKAESMGGTIHMDPTPMHVGTLAMVADAQGAPFYLMDPVPPANDPNAKYFAIPAFPSFRQAIRSRFPVTRTQGTRCRASFCNKRFTPGQHLPRRSGHMLS